MTPKLKWIAAGVGAFVVICLANSKPDPAPPVPAAAPPADQAVAPPGQPAAMPPAALDATVKPVYTLKSSEDCTVDRDQPCRRINIVVPKGESKAQIASDLSHAAQAAKESYGSVRGIAFASAEGTDQNSGYSAGRARWGSDEGTDRDYTPENPSIDYEDSYFRPEAPAQGIVAAIPESWRKQLYYDAGLAEDRATREAEAAYPTAGGDNAEQEDQAQRNYEPNMKMSQELTTKYQAEFQRRHHLTDDQYTAISVEGMTKHWLSPD